jgi:hypothetical protein
LQSTTFIENLYVESFQTLKLITLGNFLFNFF